MNLAYNYQLIPDLRKVKDMERFIAGSYWENDVWNLNDPFWDDYSIGKKSFTSRRITLYNHPEYRTRIESLRCNCIAPKLLMKPSVTDKGKDVIIAAKNKRIRELEAEVDRLSSILKSFYAKEYEKY